MRLLVVNPNTSAEITEAIASAARRAAAPGTELVVVSAPFGPRYIATRGEHLIAAYATLTALAGHVAGCDGAVVAAFTDPGLWAAREALAVPVVGIAEAGMLTACLLGARFSILTTAGRLVPVFRELAETYGLASRLASVRALERSPLDVARDPRVIADGLAALGRAAVEEDGADVLVLGGAPLGGMAAALSDRVGVPALDGVGCAVRHVEALVGMGVRKPRVGRFAPPPAQEVVGVTPELAGLFRPAEGSAGETPTA